MGLKDLGKNSPAAQRLQGLSGLAEVGSVGLSFVFALLIGTVGGWWLDQHFGWKPWGFLTGLGLGLAAGVRNVYLVTKRYWKG
ncbi:MAG: AtpZ/AtpI family protein [Acidobacteria bacterium]|nr:MAG: AtpZ/AtpI family protein [Acidobacteriota bacterium]